MMSTSGRRNRYNNLSAHAFTTPSDEILPMSPDDGFQQTTVISGLMPDSFGEMFNFLDGDSFGIGLYKTDVIATSLERFVKAGLRR